MRSSTVARDCARAECADLLAGRERPHPPGGRRPAVRDAGLQRARTDRARGGSEGERMNRPGPTTRAKVWKIRSDLAMEETDVIAAEEPMEIRVETGEKNDRTTTSLSVTMRTPGNDFELAAGFLLTEGIVDRKRDIVRLEYCTEPGISHEYNIVNAVLRPDVAVCAI